MSGMKITREVGMSRGTSEYACVECSKPRIVGNGFTHAACSMCGSEFNHYNTHTPRMCLSCAEEQNKCRWCEEVLDDADHASDEGGS